jgi:uncharacterized membrane protein SirB2
MSYSTLKLIHIGCVFLSITLFVLRGMAMWADAPLPRALRVVPHLIDSVLLVSAITLATWANFNPLQQPWLAAKLLCLVGYVVLGSIALKRGKTRGQRLAAFAAALLVLSYMIKLALSKQLGW